MRYGIMLRNKIIFHFLLFIFCIVTLKLEAKEPQIKLWKRIDISPYRGTFVSPGDLDGDGQVDFLLSQIGPLTTPSMLIALDHDGNKLWSLGDKKNIVSEPSESTCRGIASINDIDGDGQTEVIAEFWQGDGPQLLLLDGASGKIKKSIPSPFDISVRYPEGYKSSRPSPMALIAHLDGKDKLPSVILKYEASNTIPCHVVALNHELEIRWQLNLRPTAVGHIPTIADIDGDGKDEIILGETVLNPDGTIRWQYNFGVHADCTCAEDIVDDSPGKEVLVSICQTGPVYCLSGKDGKILWQKTKDEVPHGQAVWAGDFIPQCNGKELIILYSGHQGKFMTVEGRSGVELARFEHHTQKINHPELRVYPDFPVSVDWTGAKAQLLWIPVDRRLVDGYGNTVQNLGIYDDLVNEQLHCGTSKKKLAAQCIAIDLCGDHREELVLYQPYQGESIFIFTQADSDGHLKQYETQSNAYNFRTYF